MKLNTKRNLKLILASGSLAMIAAVGAACAGGGVAQSDFDALQTRVDRLQQSVDTAAQGVASLEALAESLGGLIPGGGTATGDALKLGYLAAYTGNLAEFGPAIEKGVQLAVEQINAAGGVNGQDVTYVTADSALDATQATTEAQRLIQVEGVHAIIGPLGSGPTLAVAEGVIADAGIPQISPSATAPAVAEADDNGFLFRTTIADDAQGAALANNLVEPEGVSNVGVIYINNAYGQGLEGAFADNFEGGTYISEAYGEMGVTSYLSELNTIANWDGGIINDLVIIGYAETEIILREAEQNNLFDNYFFVDGNKSVELADAVGAETLEGYKGTAPSGVPDSASSAAYDTAYEARFGELTTQPFVKEAYDAAIAIALAAERAGSLDGAAIRDQLVNVGSAGGLEVIASVESIRAGLQAAANGEDVNYEGAATSVEWNENGDIASGFVEIWQFQGGVPTPLETLPFSLN